MFSMLPLLFAETGLCYSITTTIIMEHGHMRIDPKTMVWTAQFCGELFHIHGENGIHFGAQI